MKNNKRRGSQKADDQNKIINQENKMKDEASQAREKFLEEVQKLGFPVCIQGRKALELRCQHMDSWPSRSKGKKRIRKTENDTDGALSGVPDKN